MLRRPTLRLIALTLALTISLLIPAVASSIPDAAAQSASAYRMVGYYAGYSIYEDYFVTDVRASELTHLNYAYIDISDVGQCVLADPWTDAQYPYPEDDENLSLKGNIRQLQLLRGNYPNLKILMTVGGWEYSENFSDVAATADARRRFATSCIGLMRQYLFDGIDLDWRYPVSGGPTAGRPSDKENYTLLMAELRSQLNQAALADNRDYLLTMLAPAVPSLYENIALDRIHPYVDWFNLMSFGFQGAWSELASHHAPLYGSQHDPRGAFVRENFNVHGAVQAYFDQGVPAAKIVVGVGLYGQAWRNVRSNDYFGLYQPADGVPTGTRPGGVLYYRDMLPLLGNSTYKRFYDSETGVPWLYSPDERIAISYENEQSIRNKANYVRENDLGGMMLWQLGFDDPQEPLIDAAYRALRGGS